MSADARRECECERVTHTKHTLTQHERQIPAEKRVRLVRQVWDAGVPRDVAVRCSDAQVRVADANAHWITGVSERK